MANPKTTTHAANAAAARDLKQRVISSLNRLSDRDTLPAAAAELESIARSLPQESFSPFLSCIYATDDADRSPVRRQCVRILAVLSHSHGDALAPFLSKMLAAVVRRLRDPDSAVRSACVDAVAAMSAQITKPPFSSAFLKPLSEAVVLEQGQNSQIGSAMCLAAAVDASPDPDPPQLTKLIPKLLKLLKSEGFKAKPALLSLLGSVVGAGGASTRDVLEMLIPPLIEHLSSEDWAARKAAVEALGRVAVVGKDLVPDHQRSSCLASLETRRYDKVKAVREIMNRTLELWKKVPRVSDEASSPSHPGSSTKVGTDNVGLGFVTPPPTKIVPTRSPSSDNSTTVTSGTAKTALKRNEKKSATSMIDKVDSKRPADWKFEIALPRSPPSNITCEDDLDGSFKRLSAEENVSRHIGPETQRPLFDSRGHKFGGLRSGSRVVPFHEDDGSGLATLDSNCIKKIPENQKDFEDLSLIWKQLLQIENQQSGLLDLLQRFIGSSQSGMNSLETRVHGLEIALDEISYDLALSSGRIPNTENVGNTCCKLPGTEFLSSKFWRKTEGRYSVSRLSSAGSMQSLAAMRKVAANDGDIDTLKMDGQSLQHQNANVYSDLRGNASDGAERAQFRYDGGL